ncbi:MAG: phosphoenolpyruvate--protein phosphotransferase, partial [Rhodospirillales bacterium]|nr:phosphoenolpyruvate--protein phosphotransferase [Rhodospirillales bacterium]
IGVLAIQSIGRRTYREDEVEALQTVAMVLAQVVLIGDLVGREELAPAEGASIVTRRLEGVSLNDGIGFGIAHHHQPRLTIRKYVADDAKAEYKRLDAAVADMHGTLDDFLGAVDTTEGGEYRDILESYRMFAADPGWLRRIREAIESGLTAEAAVEKTTNEIRARLGRASDPYLRERIHDFEDLARRLLQHLLGETAQATKPPPDKDFVLVARNVGPTELLNYDRSRLHGLILEEGSATSHATIVARALDVPVIGYVRDALTRIDAGDPVVIDAEHAQVFVRPSEDIWYTFKASVAAREERTAAYAAAKDLPPVTKDGVRIGVHMNAGLLVDLDHLDRFGADGIGLYRTEIPFMTRLDVPTVAAQESLYRKVLELAGDKPVVFRTLDIGGDKIVASWERVTEENPAMGWRAIRVGLDRPAFLRQQLRAMIRAAANHDLAVMFPMVANVDEFVYARRLFDLELLREEQRGRAKPRSVRLGAMIEVPSLLFQLPALLSVVDFVSVGTNDLLQFLFASDRGSPRMSERYDPLSPIVLNVLSDVVKQCEAAGVPLQICGEISVRPLNAMALIGIGFRNLSMPPRGIGPVKKMVRDVSLARLGEYMQLLRVKKDASIRPHLYAFARDHGVSI